MWFPGIDPPEAPHADEIATLLDERDHVWHLLCEAEDAADTDAIEAYRARIANIDREMDFIIRVAAPTHKLTRQK